jgi:hypothetical protein
VLKEYEAFKARYARVFAEQFAVSATWYESCTDPPFNTRKKDEKQEQAEQNELLAKIYDDEQDAEDNKYFLRETVS